MNKISKFGERVSNIASSFKENSSVNFSEVSNLTFYLIKRSVQFIMTTREALAIGSDTMPPVLFRGDYNMWRDRFLDFIYRQDLGEYIRLSLKEGPKVFTEEKPAQPDSDPPVAAHTVIKKFEDMTDPEKK
ncbi:hypothetical protein OSB04_023394 [Centaurea solstitialis]|uniref:Uncharacterized protein n=1 Tax=Centaurea solstitialis TaxID=347529 RepID=A0AA38T2L6_9ASTR|nr:hypothetical protein OSB04_023394 [Centaurea solstitialis]